MEYAVSDRLQVLDRTVQQMVGARDVLLRERIRVDGEILRLQHASGVHDGIQQLLETLVKTSQAAIKNFIEPLVTEALVARLIAAAPRFGLELLPSA